MIWNDLITITAVDAGGNGQAFNGLNITIVEDAAKVDTAEYDADKKTLTIYVDGSSVPGDVITTINAVSFFNANTTVTASLENLWQNPDVELLQTGETDKAAIYKVNFSSLSGDNIVFFASSDGLEDGDGTAYNSITVQMNDLGGVHASYNPGTTTLSLDPDSTHGQIIAALNGSANNLSKIFGAQPWVSQVQIGSPNQEAIFSFNFINEQLVFKTSATEADGGDGSAYNNLIVKYRSGGTDAAYNSFANILELDKTASTADIIAAIDGLADFYDASFTATVSPTIVAISETDGDAAGPDTYSLNLFQKIIEFNASHDGTSDGNGSGYAFNKAQIVYDVKPGGSVTAVIDTTDPAKLIFHVLNDGTSTMDDLVNAINDHSKFFDAAEQASYLSVKVTSDITAPTVNRTQDGDTSGTAAEFSFELESDTLIFNAISGNDGTAYDGIGVRLVDDAFNSAGVTASYNSTNKIITIHVLKDGTSTTEDIADVINDISADFSNARANPRVAASVANILRTTTGAGTEPAGYSLYLHGDTITFEAADGDDGINFNDIKVMVVDDADTTDGVTGERVTYNSANKVLTLHVRSDHTTKVA